MKNKALHEPFELYVSDVDCWNERPLIYHFFEIVHVLEGEGNRIVNRNTYPYRKGSIFLFTPLDCRGFYVNSATRFCSIRFSEPFLGKCKSAEERERIGQWLAQLEHIFSHHNRAGEVLIQHTGDCGMIAGLLKNAITEYEQKQPFYENNLQHLVTLMLNILARNVLNGEAVNDTGSLPDKLINRLLIHIGNHISDADKLRIDYLAAHFHLSAHYVSEYFQKHTGESLQQYITHYKMKLVKQRLAFSSLTVGQIAAELGYTDESHLGRQFRKYNDGISPAAYRKVQKAG